MMLHNIHEWKFEIFRTDEALNPNDQWEFYKINKVFSHIPARENDFDKYQVHKEDIFDSIFLCAL